MELRKAIEVRRAAQMWWNIFRQEELVLCVEWLVP